MLGLVETGLDCLSGCGFSLDGAGRPAATAPQPEKQSWPSPATPGNPFLHPSAHPALPEATRIKLISTSSSEAEIQLSTRPQALCPASKAGHRALTTALSQRFHPRRKLR